MSKVYCPHINGICEDGIPAMKDVHCAYYDSIDEACLLVESARGVVMMWATGAGRLNQQGMSKFMLTDDKIQELLDHKNLENGA